MKRITYLLIALVVIASLGLTGCGEAELGTEENPIIWALVPSGETEAVLSGFSGVADYLF
jgi:phosphonate transport system substrate-binding protein